MNRHYAQIILFVFLFSVGAFQLIRGFLIFRTPRESKILGVMRIVIGAVLGIVLPSILLLHYFNPFQ